MTSTQSFDWQNRRVLVTGASGFKGSWLCAALHGLGARVFCTMRDREQPLAAWDLFELKKAVGCFTVDITDRHAMVELLNTVEPDVVFHLAAKALVPSALRDPLHAYNVNVMGTLNLLEACRRLQMGNRLLICSTDHVFGSIDPDAIPSGGFPEESPVHFGGPYDTSKSAMELAVRSYHYTYWEQLPEIAISRCANVFGFGDINQRRVVPLFVESSVNRGSIPLRYRYSGRQFIHVTDAVTGYIQAAAAMPEGGRGRKADARPEVRTPFTPTFHFANEQYPGTPEPFIRMGELADLVAETLAVPVDDSQCIDYPKNENKVQILNCAGTRAKLGWQINRSFAQGIAELGEWYQHIGERNHLRQLLQSDLESILANLCVDNQASADALISAKNKASTASAAVNYVTNGHAVRQGMVP